MPRGLNTVDWLGSPVLTFKNSWQATDSPTSWDCLRALQVLTGGQASGKPKVTASWEVAVGPGPCLPHRAELSTAAALLRLPWAAPGPGPETPLPIDI